MCSVHLHVCDIHVTLKQLLFCQIARVADKKFENPQTSNLNRVLLDCIAIHELMAERATPMDKAEQQKSKLVSKTIS